MTLTVHLRAFKDHQLLGTALIIKAPKPPAYVSWAIPPPPAPPPVWEIPGSATGRYTIIGTKAGIPTF